VETRTTRLFAEDTDIFLTYCTNAMAAVREIDGARMVELGEPLAVGADYGLTIVNGASAAARRFAAFVVTKPAQDILARHGFTPVATP
jgi:molybdate transport system substrate-binding protein